MTHDLLNRQPSSRNSSFAEEPLIRRPSLSLVKDLLQNDTALSPFILEKGVWNDDLEELLSTVNFPFDVKEGDFLRSYGLSGPSVLSSCLSLHFADLFFGKDWVMLGKGSFTRGRAPNLFYAYRQGDSITMGYRNEVYLMADDQKAAIGREEGSRTVVLPDAYALSELFSYEQFRKGFPALPIMFGKRLAGKTF